MTGRVTVRSDSRIFSGWKTVEVDTSIESAVSTASMTIAGRVQAEFNAILAGDPVEVWVDDHRMFSGYATKVTGRETDAESMVSVQAESRTVDAVDCSIPAQVWRNVRFEDLLAEWLSPYDLGVNFAVAEAASYRVGRYRTTPGESIFDGADKLSRELRVLVTDDENGLLTLTRAGLAGDCVDPIQLPGNALSVSFEDDVSERFSDLEVKSQRASGEVDPVTTGTFIDRFVGRPRRKLIVPERGTTQGEAIWRAQWEALTRAGRSMRRSYTVQGWLQSDGTPWRKNTNAVVTDSRRGHIATPLLVTACLHTLGEDGSKTVLTLSPASAYTPEPVRQPSGRAGSVSGRWSRWDAGGVE